MFVCLFLSLIVQLQWRTWERVSWANALGAKLRDSKIATGFHPPPPPAWLPGIVPPRLHSFYLQSTGHSEQSKVWLLFSACPQKSREEKAGSGKKLQRWLQLQSAIAATVKAFFLLLTPSFTLKLHFTPSFTHSFTPRPLHFKNRRAAPGLEWESSDNGCDRGHSQSQSLSFQGSPALLLFFKRSEERRVGRFLKWQKPAEVTALTL